MDGEETTASILAGSSPFSPAQGDKPAAPEAPAPVADTAPPAVTKETVRDDSGRFAPKAESKPEAKAEPEVKAPKPEPMVPLSALLAERAKRKEPEAAKPKVSIFEDEDAGIRERVADEVNPMREALLELSLEITRAKHEDFDEVAEFFAKAAESDPRLWQSMQTARNPASYIYGVGKQMRELSDVGGDISRYKDKVTSEVKAQLAKETEARKALETQLETIQKQLKDIQSLPRSLNTVPASSGPQSIAEQDDDDTTSIVRFGNKRN